MPRASFEELEIRTSDGATLRALVDDPPGDRELRGTLVLAHGLFARRSAFGTRDRPGLSGEMTARGFRTIAFDFRGYGDSAATAGGSGYDDLVRHDLPAVTDCARARGEGRPVIVVGHSLGGHVALAAQGTGRLAADALVLLATNVWLRDLERSRLRWAAKLAAAHAALTVSEYVERRGLSRLLRVDDASQRIARELCGMVTDRRWTSADGRDDYRAALSGVKVPVAAVLGERDRVRCHPESGEAFARLCAGRVAVFHATVRHDELLSSSRARGSVLDAIAWALAQARP